MTGRWILFRKEDFGATLYQRPEPCLEIGTSVFINFFQRI